MAIPGHEFLSAHFSNNERTTVESYWITPDGKETRVEYIEAKDGDPNWENLLTHTNIDKLHEDTYKHIKNTQKAFENQAIQIAKDQGILQDFQDKNVINNAIVKILFEQDNDSDSKNTLFVFKLKLFELDFVKNCKSRKMKSELRKAENIRQATKIAIDIFEQSN
mgnify:CR=1 FL=1|tara:strand:- start:362 stop:856 length:495 start_codon:yes stop_codon:yes gene_type:complete